MQIEYAIKDPSNARIENDTEVYFGQELWENAKLQTEVECMSDWYELLVQAERRMYAEQQGA